MRAFIQKIIDYMTIRAFIRKIINILKPTVWNIMARNIIKLNRNWERNNLTGALFNTHGVNVICQMHLLELCKSNLFAFNYLLIVL